MNPPFIKICLVSKFSKCLRLHAIRRFPTVITILPTILILAILTSAQSTKSPAIKKTQQLSKLNAEQIATKFFPKIVQIHCEGGNGKRSQGSGLVIDSGMILTNYHVIKGMNRGTATVVSNPQKEWRIENVLFSDSESDLALLSFRSPAVNGAESSRISFADRISIGERVYVLSNPKGLTGTISTGIISSEIREIVDFSRKFDEIRKFDLLQFDASVSPGSSGGAVFNSYGKVVGIVTSSLKSGQNLNFAVPYSAINSFITSFRRMRPRENFMSITPTGSDQWSVNALVNLSDGLKLREISTGNAIVELERMITTERRALGSDRYLVAGIYDRVDKVRISQCVLSYTQSQVQPEIRRIVTVNHVADLTYIKHISIAQRSPGSVELIFFGESVKKVGNSVETEDSWHDSRMLIIVTTKSKQLRVISFLNILKKYCNNGDISAKPATPNVKDAVDFISSRFAGRSFTRYGRIYDYHFDDFSDCVMTFRESVKIDGGKSVKVHKVDFKNIWVPGALIGANNFYPRVNGNITLDPVTIYSSDIVDGYLRNEIPVSDAFRRLSKICRKKKLVFRPIPKER